MNYSSNLYDLCHLAFKKRNKKRFVRLVKSFIRSRKTSNPQARQASRDLFNNALHQLKEDETRADYDAEEKQLFKKTQGEKDNDR